MTPVLAFYNGSCMHEFWLLAYKVRSAVMVVHAQQRRECVLITTFLIDIIIDVYHCHNRDLYMIQMHSHAI